MSISIFNTSCSRSIIYLMLWTLFLVFGGCTYKVNSLVDAPDKNPGDLRCERDIPENVITTGDDGGLCTLRAAIMETNATGWEDTIEIPSGHYSLLLPPNVGGGVLRITEDVRILGAGASRVFVDGNHQTRVFEVGGDSHPKVSISGLTIQNGRGGVSLPGAGIRVLKGSTLALSDCVVENNETRAPGGGIGNAGRLHVLNCTIQNNRVPIGLGPSDNNDSGGAQHSAGGIMNFQSGHLIIENSTISGNVSNRGGGLRNGGGRLRVQNSTISGNTARFQGGGIMNHGPAEIFFSTIVNNRARSTSIGGSENEEEGGGGIINTGEITMRSSILTQNQDKEDGLPEFLEHFSPDCRSHSGGAITSEGQNIIGIRTNNCNFIFHSTDVVGSSGNPLPQQVLPLAQNGGRTPTHLLKSDSHAIDRAVSPPCPQTDQRGFFRPADGNENGNKECDSGSLERGAIPPNLPISGSGTSSLESPDISSPIVGFNPSSN